MRANFSFACRLLRSGADQYKRLAYGAPTSAYWEGLMKALVAILMTVLLGACSSVTTQPRTNTVSEELRPTSPFLDAADYSNRIGLVMHDALASHRFVNPWIVVRGSDESLWFVADRFESEHRFDRVRVQVTADEHVTAIITPYQFGPSDWAILGRAFADFRPEAKLIAGEIAAKLSGSPR
jgi:hypothetical protein